MLLCSCPFCSRYMLYSIVPGTVQNLMANALSPRSMRVSWQPPMEEERNGEILDYHVNVTLVGSTGEPHTFTTPTTSIVVDSLHPHYIYLCSVTARTRAGLGPVTTILERLLPDSEKDNKIDSTFICTTRPTVYHTLLSGTLCSSIIMSSIIISP